MEKVHVETKTRNVSLIHFLDVWEFYISIVKKENCLFGNGKYKRKMKNKSEK